eukprot:1150904_1
MIQIRFELGQTEWILAISKYRSISSTDKDIPTLRDDVYNKLLSECGGPILQSISFGINVIVLSARISSHKKGEMHRGTVNLLVGQTSINTFLEEGIDRQFRGFMEILTQTRLFMAFTSTWNS